MVEKFVIHEELFTLPFLLFPGTSDDLDFCNIGAGVNCRRAGGA